MQRMFTQHCLILFCLIFLSITLYTKNSYGQILEVYLIGQQMKGDYTTVLEQKLELSDNTAFGFGTGLNLDKFNLNIDFIFGSTVVRMNNKSLDSKLFFFDANLDYSFFDCAVTPMVTAGIGSISFSDSFVQVKNLSETDFSYNIGFGLKYTFFDNYLVKGLYRATWTKLKETDNSILFNGISVDLGYVF